MMDVLMKIKNLQKQKGWSNYKLAKISGISPSTLSSLYKNSNTPTIPILEQLCNGFGITLAAFFAEEMDFLSEQQKQLFDLYAKLSNVQREKAIAYITGMIDS